MTWTRGGTQRALFFALLLGTVALAACGSDTVTPTSTPVAVSGTPLDEHRTLGEPLTVENLTVWPIYTDAPRDMGEYLTLHEAQEQGLAEVRETGGGAQQIDITNFVEQEIVLELAAGLDPEPAEEATAPSVPQQDGDEVESVNGQPVPQGQVRLGQTAQQVEVLFDEE
ncbi:MAG: ARPP-1 family domain-containing protein, partial [Planctomycetota bacterium]